MAGFFAPNWRRRAGGAAPAPVLASLNPNTATTAGGSSMQCIGSSIVSGAQVEVDGTLYAGTYIGAARVDLAAVPAHAAGGVSVRIKNPDGQFSNALTLTYASATVDPATLTPSGYWEQRGDASDYSLGGGIWAKRSTAGSNWVQPTSGSRPAVGSLVDGKAPIEIHGTGKSLTLAESMSTLGTNAEFCLSGLFYIPSGLTMGVALYNGATFFGDVAQYWYMACGVDPADSVNKIGFGLYDSAAVLVRCTVPVNTWFQANVRHFGGLLSLNANAAPVAAADGVKAKAAGNIGVANSTISSAANFTDAPGALMLSGFIKQTMADADFGTIRTWWRGTQYPSLAGVLPA